MLDSTPEVPDDTDVLLARELHLFLDRCEAKANGKKKGVIAEFRQALSSDYDDLHDLTLLFGHPVARRFRRLLQPFLKRFGIVRLAETKPDVVVLDEPSAEQETNESALAAPELKVSTRSRPRPSKKEKGRTVEELKHRLGVGSPNTPRLSTPPKR